jgi:hypothetical protein
MIASSNLIVDLSYALVDASDAVFGGVRFSCRPINAPRG